MISSYYLWKWADNDLPGKPNEVFSALIKGALHPALQTFNAKPLLRRLESFADNRRKFDEEWNWQVHPSNDPTEARFVFLTGPHLNYSQDRATSFSNTMNGLEISGYDEQYGHVIHLLRAKLNCFLYGQDHRERHYDITPDEVPSLLRRIDREATDPFAVLEDRRHYFVQCYAHKRRFCVEWREHYDTNNWYNFAHWRAYNLKWLRARRHAAPTQRKRTDHDTLTFAETVNIFQAFLRGESKPLRYHWRDFKPSLEREERRKKARSGAK